MKRAFTMLVFATSLLVAACGSGASGTDPIEPMSPDSSLEASPESSPETMSPEASPS